LGTGNDQLHSDRVFYKQNYRFHSLEVPRAADRLNMYRDTGKLEHR
jgi:hypothetical protein